MYPIRTHVTDLSKQLIIVACMAFEGCGMRLVLSHDASPIVPKELNMQSPGNPTDPRNSGSPIPEMVAATSAPFYIGPGITNILLPMHAPTGPAREHEGSLPKQVVLLFENIKSKVRAPSFRVYLNLPAGEQPERHPELLAGNLGMFGLVESSVPRGNHGGDGKNMSLEITGLYARLAVLKDWDSRSLQVSFVPAKWEATVPQVQVGRVSLYLQ